MLAQYWSLLLACSFQVCVAASRQPPRAVGDAPQPMPPIPSCALPCIVSAMSESTCPATDTQCVCHDPQVQKSAAACISQACSLADSLSAKNATQTACGVPVRSKTRQYYTMSVTLGVLAVSLVLVRVGFKRFWSPSRSLGPDDKIILVTLALRVSGTVLNVKGLADHGLGRDVWTMSARELSTFVMWLYIMEVLYLAELSLLKLSLSAFYLSVFPGTGVRRLLWGVCAINALFGVAFVTAAIFQCSPIHYWWTQYGEHPGRGRCININAMGWSNATMSVLIDVVMIAVPLSQISKLNLHWRRKVGVVIMFLTGTFVTVVSILRLRSLVSFANSNNPTWDQWEVAYWSTIEVNIGMICTCLPSLRLLLLRLFPRLLGSTTASGDRVSYAHASRGQTVLRSLTSLESHENELTDLENAKGSDCQSNLTKSTHVLVKSEEHP